MARAEAETVLVNLRILKTELNKSGLQISDAELTDDELRGGVIAVDNHFFEQFTVRKNGSRRGEFQNARAATPVAALQRDRGGQGEFSLLDGLEGRAHNRQLDQTGAGKNV